jgi:hypothetical protein
MSEGRINALLNSIKTKAQKLYEAGAQEKSAEENLIEQLKTAKQQQPLSMLPIQDETMLSYNTAGPLVMAMNSPVQPLKNLPLQQGATLPKFVRNMGRLSTDDLVDMARGSRVMNDIGRKAAQPQQTADIQNAINTLEAMGMDTKTTTNSTLAKRIRALMDFYDERGMVPIDERLPDAKDFNIPKLF